MMENKLVSKIIKWKGIILNNQIPITNDQFVIINDQFPITNGNRVNLL